ncbi:MAG TPA: YraN family protein [Candidatus Saccharimonadales bacterium]|nr:YraN family protein [Candidatus Saccharimonadales bacterium]
MSTAIGRTAEAVAAEFLRTKGHTILAQNWRTRWCEIDIVTQNGCIVHFVEVKYRAKHTWGSGFDYITPRKLQQMQFAAEFWVAKHRLKSDYFLSAVELTGVPPQVAGFVEGI